MCVCSPPFPSPWKPVFLISRLSAEHGRRRATLWMYYVLPLKWFFCVHQWLTYSNLVIWASNHCRFTTFLHKPCFALSQWVTNSEANKDEVPAAGSVQRGETTLSDLYTPWISSAVWGLVFALNPVVQQWRFFSHKSVWNAMGLTLWLHRVIYSKFKT